MTLNEFNLLSPKEKEVAVMKGVFLERRYEAGQTVALYSVGNFFAELWYDSTINEVTMLYGFRSPERLLPYLSRLRFDWQIP